MFAQNDFGDGLTPLEKQFALQLDVEAELTDGQEANESLLFKYLDHIRVNPIKVTDYFKDLQWVNTSRPLSLQSDLKGLIVLCDFFTYCCINCLHILPFLHSVDEKYLADEVQLLGILSPKFENEKSMRNISNAVLRHGILHPVCNDSNFKLWKQLNISCWPTVVIIGPNAELLFMLTGELIIRNKLNLYVDICLKYFKLKNELIHKQKLSLPVELLKNCHQNELCYPTKIASSPSGSKFAIANTQKNAIIIFDAQGTIEHVIGSNEQKSAGFKDGHFEKTLFNFPQGVTWADEDTVFVCDTQNHSIRKVSLATKCVETVCGNGSHGEDRKGGLFGKEQALSSPWDCVYDSKIRRLYIAMAGSHQIWVLVLSEYGDTINGKQYKYGQCVCLAGDGVEQNRNGKSLDKSSFAQPSGIAIGQNLIFIADSESSSIRIVDLNANCVSILAGANSNVVDLFAFGDKDGVGTKCKLQHCMGVCSDSGSNSIYIADTFNHKIKVVNIASRECETLEFDKSEIDCLNEPNGLCLCMLDTQSSNTLAKCLLVADTNSHRIVCIDLNRKQASIFPLFRSIKSDEPKDETDSYHTKCHQDPICLSPKDPLQLKLDFSFNGDLKAEPGAKHLIKLTTNDCRLSTEPASIQTSNLNATTFTINCLEQNADGMVSIECHLNLCNSKSNYCTFAKILVEQPVVFSESAHANSLVVKRIQIKM